VKAPTPDDTVATSGSSAAPNDDPRAHELQVEDVIVGTGTEAKVGDAVRVHYTGKLANGTVFDSSVERGQPATFPLNQVIKCWTEGVQQMKVGGKARLICPPDVAYGDRGAPPKIKPGSTLQFDVELLEIVKEQPPAAAPTGAAPKPDAKKEEPKK